MSVIWRYSGAITKSNPGILSQLLYHHTRYTWTYILLYFYEHLLCFYVTLYLGLGLGRGCSGPCIPQIPGSFGVLTKVWYTDTNIALISMNMSSQGTGDLGQDSESTSAAERAATPQEKNGSAHNGCTRGTGWGQLCFDYCKYNGHHGGHAMVRCCSCAVWFHEDCIAQNEEFVPGVWACFRCRRMPAQVEGMVQTVTSLTDMVKTLTNALAQLSTKYEENCQKTAAIHDKLLSENAELRKQIAENFQKTSAEQWQQFSKAHGTAIFGSSIIRDIDPNKLVATKCISISGGLIKDIQNEIDNFPPHRKLSRAVLVIGGNDCDSSGAGGDVTDMLNQYKDLINSTKSIANSITVSSICPRNRSADVTECICSLNAGLQALCSDLDIEFTDHNPSFHLQDGSLNDGYLLPDNVHLTRAATNRLVTNLKLELRQCVDSAHSDHRRLRVQHQAPAVPHNRDEPRDEPRDADELEGINLDDPFWTVVQSKHQRKSKTHKAQPAAPIPTQSQPRPHGLGHTRGPARLQPQHPAQHPAQHSAQYSQPPYAAPGHTKNGSASTYTKQYARRPIPFNSQSQQKHPTPLMEINTTKPIAYSRLINPPPASLSRDTVSTQCQLCLGWGHSAVTCKSKDSTCYSCGKIGHFSRACMA